MRALVGAILISWFICIAFNIANADNLQRKSAANATQNRVMIFTADWCSTCQQFKMTTMQDRGVQQKLQRYNIVHVDVTTPTKENQVIQRAYKVFGVPTIIIFRNGKETQRFAGFVSAEQLRRAL